MRCTDCPLVDQLTATAAAEVWLNLDVEVDDEVINSPLLIDAPEGVEGRRGERRCSKQMSLCLCVCMLINTARRVVLLPPRAIEINNVIYYCRLVCFSATDVDRKNGKKRKKRQERMKKSEETEVENPDDHHGDVSSTVMCVHVHAVIN